MEGERYDHDKNQHFLVRMQKGFKCICEMCSCGKHRCPRKQVKGDFQTSYANQYQSYKVIPVLQPPRPIYPERHYNPQVLKSNYKEAYLPMKVEEPVIAASRIGHIGRSILKSEPFVPDTSYKSQFKPFTVEAAQEQISESRFKLADSREKVQAKFQGESAYKSQFHQVTIPKIQRYKAPAYRNQTPFSGSSSYQNDFHNFKVQAIRERPQVVPKRNQVKFEGSSTYNNNYGSFKVVPVAQSPLTYNINSPNQNYIKITSRIVDQQIELYLFH